MRLPCNRALKGTVAAERSKQMSLYKINYPFNEKIDNTKWEKLFSAIEEFNNNNLNKTGKYILNNIPLKYQKSLFTLLSAIYLETDFVIWDDIKRKISSLEKISQIKKKNPLKRLFSKKEKKNIIHLQPGREKKEEYVEMYINVGKDRQIFPNHLIQFIRQSMKIRHDQIRGIRIFNKYSFFKVPKYLGEKTIILLSVKKFREKKIVVNFSKQSIEQ